MKKLIILLIGIVAFTYSVKAQSGATVHSYCHVQYNPEKDEMYYKSVENDYHNEVSGSMKYDHSKFLSDNIADLGKSFLDKVYNELK